MPDTDHQESLRIDAQVAYDFDNPGRRSFLDKPFRDIDADNPDDLSEDVLRMHGWTGETAIVTRWLDTELQERISNELAHPRVVGRYRYTLETGKTSVVDGGRLLARLREKIGEPSPAGRPITEQDVLMLAITLVGVKSPGVDDEAVLKDAWVGNTHITGGAYSRWATSWEQELGIDG